MAGPSSTHTPGCEAPHARHQSQSKSNSVGNVATKQREQRKEQVQLSHNQFNAQPALERSQRTPARSQQ
eukprot:9047158-Pyramimonas_sp.AAC.1